MVNSKLSAQVNEPFINSSFEMAAFELSERLMALKWTGLAEMGEMFFDFMLFYFEGLEPQFVAHIGHKTIVLAEFAATLEHTDLLLSCNWSANR